MTITGRIAPLIATLGLSVLAINHYDKSLVVDDFLAVKPLSEDTFPKPIYEAGDTFPKPIYEAEDVLVRIDQKEFECMRANMYFEARNQRSDDAFIAVGYTVLNRMESKSYKPNTICGVVQQARIGANGQPVRHKCQFSWFCDGKPDVPNLNNVIERQAWERATELAIAVMRREVDNPIGRATMYHATYVQPRWDYSKLNRIARIETHIFYETKA